MEKLLEHIFGILQTTFVVVGMVNMGLQHTFGQIVTPLKKPGLVLRALSANFVCVPVFVALILAVIPLSDRRIMLSFGTGQCNIAPVALVASMQFPTLPVQELMSAVFPRKSTMIQQQKSLGK